MNITIYFPLFLQGTLVTLAAWVMSGTLSLIIGILLGIISSHFVSSSKTIAAIKTYTFITKGIPAYVQILLFYFVLPSLLHIQISGFVSASIALALCSSGYVTEIMRSAINSIDTGQWQACFVLGYNTRQTIIRIILPQALRRALPALIGEVEQLIKSTSLLATIGVTEITRVGMNIISRELNPLPVYVSIAAIYLLFSAILNIFMAIAEKEASYGRN